MKEMMSGKYIGNQVNDSPLTFETQSGETIDISEIIYSGGVKHLTDAEMFFLLDELKRVTQFIIFARRIDGDNER